MNNLDSKIRDHKQITENYLTRLTTIYKNINLHAEGKDLNEKVIPLIKRHTPSIMFYGVYNSGKSSIINAIFGEYIAEVNDIPTTKAVKKIDWKGFDLTDTPGINANDEHNAIAISEIEKNDVILFVVDDGGSFDTDLVAKEILKIIKANKPLLVVVNEKIAIHEIDMKNSEKESDATFKIRHKLIQNVVLEAERQQIKNVEKKFEVLSVNALSAYTMKIATKTIKKEDAAANELILKSSRIRDLEVAIEKLLEQASGIRQLITPIDVMFNSSKKLRNNLFKLAKNDDEKKYLEQVQMIREQKENLKNSILLRGRNEIFMSGDSIFSLAINGQDSKSVAGELSEKLKKITTEEFGRANLVIKSNLCMKSADVQPVAKFEMPEIELPESAPKVNDNILDILSLIPKLPPIVVPIIPEPRIPITIIATIIDKVIGMFNDKKRVEEENARLREAIAEQNAQIQAAVSGQIASIMSMNSRIRSEMSRIEEEYAIYVTEIINEAFAPLLKNLEESIANASKNVKSASEMLDQLETLIGEIDIFRDGLK